MANVVDDDGSSRTFRRSEHGLVITAGSVKSIALIVTVLATLIGGVTAAVRFFDRTKDAPSRVEFVDHVRADSAIHAAQAVHTMSTDSVITKALRDQHQTTCFVYHNPRPFCDDLRGTP